MTQYKVTIKNRDYSEWDIIDENGVILNDKTSLIKNPVDNKLYNNDIIDESGNLIEKSPIRDDETIHGILITSGKTYGRANINNKQGKLLYKCVPNDKSLPCFLIPFEEKNIGFSKNKQDKYITFRIKEWIDKHPVGTLTNNFGDVDNIDNYIEYKMSCKHLNDSFQQLNKIIIRKLREYTLDKIPYYYNNKPIEDRRIYDIITIDSYNCEDIDDAIGISNVYDNTVLSIYITNVPLMLEYLNLWEFITNRVSTIYLIEQKLPIFSKQLSDNLFSLKSDNDRVAFVLDVYINNNTHRIEDVKYNNVIINVKKNYTYESMELLKLPLYDKIKNLVIKMNDYCWNSRYIEEITNSHHVIEYCMILMNHQCARILLNKPNGIFRTSTKKESLLLCNNVQLNYILNNISGKYCSIKNISPHYMISTGLECYTHITSPIRRIVDCVNMLILQKDYIDWSDGAIMFLNKWTSQEMIETINSKTKDIKKLENEINIMKTYEKNNNIYFGTIFDKTPIEKKSNEEKQMYKYKIYVEKLKLISNVKSNKEYTEYQMVDVSIHQFLDEVKMYKKIRLQLIS